jgi:Domain of unknown function (DUF4129)
VDARRLIPIGAAVTALLVLAGAASHGRPLSTGVGSGPSAAFFDYVATTLVVFAFIMLAVVLYALLSDRTGGGNPRRGRWSLTSTLLMLAGAALLAYLISTSNFERRLKNLEQRANKPQTQPPPYAQRKPPKDLRNARIRWDEVAIVLVLVAGSGVYFYVTRTRRRPLRPIAFRRGAVSRALDDSLDDLRNDPDVRRAIIAAYARMEHALAVAGMHRKPSEAPFEYLERMLAELDAGADGAHRLTELFERAKFSHHELGEAMREEAIDALVAVRDDLRNPAPGPVAA